MREQACFQKVPKLLIHSNALPAKTAPRRVALRVLPYLALLYLVAYLDRANVSFAGPAMRADLGFSDSLFGFGTGIFFVGYLLLAIPGALIVVRWGARRWIALVLLAWGCITACLGLVHTPIQFISVRSLLGIAEGGFFPGLIVYMNQWFCRRDRARAIACLIIASPIAMAIGAPIASSLLKVHWLGIAGWRWLFIMEGIPAIVLGGLTVFYLTDRPGESRWLQPEERAWLVGELRAEAATHPAATHLKWWAALMHGRVLLLTLAHFFACAAGYGFTMWLPTILEQSRHAKAGIGVNGAALAFLPYCCAVSGTLLVSRSSDRSAHPGRYACGCFIAGGGFLFLSAMTGNSEKLMLLCFCLAGSVVYAWIAPFWVLPTLLLQDEAMATAIGLINAVGNIGGFAGSFLIGYLLTGGWSQQGATLWLSTSYFLAAVFTAAALCERSVNEAAGVSHFRRGLTLRRWFRMTMHP